MMRSRTRPIWALTVLACLIVVVVLSALTGTAVGTANTLPFTITPPAKSDTALANAVTSVTDAAGASAAAEVAGESGTSGKAGADVEAVFSLKASDLGDFSGTVPSLTSPSAIVVNMNTGQVLYEHQATVKRPMASTTKIMTAVLVLESLPLNQEVTISAEAAGTSEVAAFLARGDVLTVEQLLYCLLVHSSNAAAMALAEAAGGSVEAFVERMNAKAAELGMQNTHFINPSGLDAQGHYSTARDMAVLGRYAMQNAQFRKFVSTRNYTLVIAGKGRTYKFENTNKLLVRADWVTGVKTGLTPRADQCLVAAGTKDGVSILSVILGQPSTKVCWDESEALLNYGFSQYKHVIFFEAGAPVAEADVPYELQGQVHLVTKDRLEMDLYKEDYVTIAVSLDRPLALPVRAGESFGEVIVVREGDKLTAVDLVADRSYESANLGTKITYFWDRFSQWIGEVL